MTVLEMAKLLDAKLLIPGGNRQALVKGVAVHSQEVHSGWVFVAVRGVQQDGSRYIDDAVRRGAIAVLAEIECWVPDGVAMLVVPDCRLAVAQLANSLFDSPSHSLRVIGITGTNGKTTTATLLKSIFTDLGESTGMLGTISYEIGERRISAPRTTPDAATLQQLLGGMVKAGCRNAVLEVSSHALVQKRTAYVNFAAAAFTNLTQDHLDYHETMEAYFAAKASLLRELPAGRVGVCNVDDAWGQKLASEDLACDVIRTGITSAADVRATIKSATLTDSAFEIVSPWGDHLVQLPLPGVHNVHNALMSFTLACALGCDAASVVKSLGCASPVRGRLQRIPSRAPFDVFVDYAHTDDALRNVLSALRKYVKGRLVVVFGCGGGRDKQKRFLMGAVVHELADKAMITTDNPRNEKPEDIIAAIVAAFPEGSDVEMEIDREKAIAHVFENAKAGDVICIAGKGHETYQEVEGRMLPFDDVEVAKRLLDKMGYGGEGKS